MKAKILSLITLLAILAIILIWTATPQRSAALAPAALLDVPEATPGDLEIRNLQIQPKEPIVRKAVSIYFELVNNTDQDIFIGRMGIGLRGPDACAPENPWNAPIPFDPGGWDNQVVPARSWKRFSRWLDSTFSRPGVYIIEPVYVSNLGQYLPFKKSTPLWFDVLDENENKVTPNCLIVEEPLVISPTPVQQGNVVQAKFRIKNRSSRNITLQRLLAAGRWSTDPDLLNWSSPNNADFPNASSSQIVLKPGQAYDYVVKTHFDNQGYYFAEPWRQEAGNAGKYYTGGIWGGNRVYFMVGETVVENVPLYLQKDMNWSTDPYGRYPETDSINTIGEWGCNLTSAAMIVSYHSNTLDHNPKVLNEWLRSNDGYDMNNYVIHDKVIRYACNKGVKLAFDGLLPGPNDQKLDKYLLTGNPVILGVVGRDRQNKEFQHYVVATGKMTINGRSTYMINDPLSGKTTLDKHYNNTYNQILLYRSSSKCGTKMVEIRVHSPVHLVVTDPLGRKSGYDPRTGATWNEIPDTGYVSQTIVAPDGNALPESKVMVIPNPVEGEYNFQVIGYDSGSYLVEVFKSDADKTSKEVFSGFAQPGSVDEYSVQYTTRYVTYLPLTLNNYGFSTNSGIHGRVTYHGSPIEGINIQLRFYDGSSWSVIRNSTTQADGTYTFTDAPTLVPGQKYYVRYLNGNDGGNADNPNYLWLWHSFYLTSYTAGTSIAGGDFDIANVALEYPADGATVALPHTFRWIPRAATPSDSYEFDLYDPTDYEPWWWTDPALGYVNSYTLSNLPADFTFGAQYGWDVWIYSPDGGYGVSYETRSVTFSTLSGPSIRVEPPSGTFGTQFTIYGSGFTPGETVQQWVITPSGERLDDPTPEAVDRQGNYTSWVRIDDGPSGTYTLYARGNQSQQTVSVQFQLTSSMGGLDMSRTIKVLWK